MNAHLVMSEVYFLNLKYHTSTMAVKKPNQKKITMARMEAPIDAHQE